MKIIIAQLNFKVGDIQGNLKKILTEYQKVKNEQALLVLSELALTGYYPQDLLLRKSFLDQQWQALDVLKQETTNNICGIVVGYAAKNKSGEGKGLFNALAVLHNGKQIFEYHKQLLPTYNVFDEVRHFEPGSTSSVLKFQGLNIGFLICEDAWFELSQSIYTLDPVAELVNSELDCVISVNASPSNLGKHQERYRIARKITEQLKVPFIYVNQVGGNDELVFDGASFIMNPLGSRVVQANAFEEAVITSDISKLSQRKDGLSIADSDEICKEAFLFRQVVLGIRDYVRKCGFERVVIGSSGGIDSAVTLAICAEALGAKNVTAITMPSVYSSSGSVDDSKSLCKNLGVSLLTAPIAEEFELAVKQFQAFTGEHPSGLTKENMQARIRGRILMEFSNHFGDLVISTGNKSEMSVGYATLYGDMNGGVNPLGDLYKMEVYAIAKWLNQAAGKELVPISIIEKEPSAELSAGQQDSDSLPEYPLLDAVLKLYIEGDLLSDQESAICLETIRSYQGSEELIQRIHAMVDRAEFKRRQAPPIIRVQKRSFGMGRWLPVAAKY